MYHIKSSRNALQHRCTEWTFVSGGRFFSVPVGWGGMIEDCLLHVTELDAKCPVPATQGDAPMIPIQISSFVEMYCSRCPYQIRIYGQA